MRFIEGGRWEWSAGVEYSYRGYSKCVWNSGAAAPFFTDGSAIALRSSVQRWLIPLAGTAIHVELQRERGIRNLLQGSALKIRTTGRTLAARWLPRARGDDYDETQVSLRGGRTIGDVPFDELFTLGFDRDTPLRLRGHPGLRAGQKGRCAAGKEFCAGECGDGQDCLSEWDFHC